MFEWPAEKGSKIVSLECDLKEKSLEEYLMFNPIIDYLNNEMDNGDDDSDYDSDDSEFDFSTTTLERLTLILSCYSQYIVEQKEYAQHKSLLQKVRDEYLIDTVLSPITNCVQMCWEFYDLPIDQSNMTLSELYIANAKDKLPGNLVDFFSHLVQGCVDSYMSFYHCEEDNDEMGDVLVKEVATGELTTVLLPFEYDFKAGTLLFMRTLLVPETPECNLAMTLPYIVEGVSKEECQKFLKQSGVDVESPLSKKQISQLMKGYSINLNLHDYIREHYLDWDYDLHFLEGLPTNLLKLAKGT